MIDKAAKTRRIFPIVLCDSQHNPNNMRISMSKPKRKEQHKCNNTTSRLPIELPRVNC